MLSLQSKLLKVYTALNSVEDASHNAVPCYHYRRPKTPTTGYMVWMEDGEDTSAEFNNKKEEQQIHGTVDYFTQTEFDPVVDNIQEALDAARVGFRLNSVQYEDDTKLIHYEWEFWVA